MSPCESRSSTRSSSVKSVLRKQSLRLSPNSMIFSRPDLTLMFMFKYLTYAVAAACLTAVAVSAHAGVTNDIPSCYAANHIKPAAGGADHELFIAIDQTTVFNEKLQAQIAEMAGKSVK